MQVRYDRLILVMGDDELEQFCREWAETIPEYVQAFRYGTSGDKGRDVVGFLTPQRHEGLWDNYQCKQYSKRLGVSDGLLAVGKVLYWASRGEFTAPRRFYFVAPKGLNQNLTRLVDKPSEFKKELLEKWGTVCASSIISRKTIPMDDALQSVLDAFDYTAIHKVTIDEIMTSAAIKPLLVAKFGADPGAYPVGTVPNDVCLEELKYLQALLEAYSEREKTTFAATDEVFAHPVHGPDLRDHRERYFQAEAFQKFYRDNTTPEIIAAFRKDIHFGIKGKLKAPAADTLARIDAVMAHAATVLPAGPLAKYAHVPVKQGVCHHLVSDDEMSWKIE